jgi:hypothetical protein
MHGAALRFWYWAALQDGGREGRFRAEAGASYDGSCRESQDNECGPCATAGTCVTAISFDKNQRRLVMGTNGGVVTVWNFNNGSLLRRWAY